uniref:Uncharacterized protein n=1 Tax=Mycena chlorophos TaxID=658473 RepID=A0ABQ0M522_MYCCL|nr:predicted protein [Mycena chlorophos]
MYVPEDSATTTATTTATATADMRNSTSATASASGSNATATATVHGDGTATVSVTAVTEVNADPTTPSRRSARLLDGGAGATLPIQDDMIAKSALEYRVEHDLKWSKVDSYVDFVASTRYR